jgi:ribonuclease HI
LNARGTELQIFTDGSMRNGKVGCSLAVVTEDTVQEEATLTVGNDEMINVYIAELEAITEAAEWAAGLPSTALEAWGVTIYSDNMSALQATANPRHQSGQRLIKRTMGAIEKALASGRRVHLAWVPGHAGIPGNEAADRLAAMSTKEDSVINLARYGINTSNIIEPLNGTWSEISNLPPLKLIDEIYTVVMKTFYDRYHRTVKDLVLPDAILKLFQERYQWSRRYKVFQKPKGS